jgi:hypothetical protein
LARKTTDRGLGFRHQQAVDYLRLRLTDGSPCDWCGRPRWLDATKNWDYNPEAATRGNGVLQGDHSGMSRSESLRRGEKVLPPDRLLHAECNRQRGAGGNDHLAVNNRGMAQVDIGESTPSMPWPWD